MLNPIKYFEDSAHLSGLRFGLGEIAIRQGQSGDGFYFVRSGCLRVMKQDREGSSETVGYLFDGDHFGEGALLTGQGHRATVRVVEDSEVVVVSRDAFLKAVKKDVGLRAYFEDQVAYVAHRNFTRFLKGGSNQVPDGAMRAFWDHLEKRMVREGEVVVERGEACDGFYLIGEGLLDAVDEEGKHRDLNAGDFFGDRAILTGQPSGFTIRAKTDCVFYFLSKRYFNKSIIEIKSLKSGLEAGGVLWEEADCTDKKTEGHKKRGWWGKNGQNAQTVSMVVHQKEPEKPSSTHTVKFPFLKQHDQSDCGAACLGMICKYYKMPIGLSRLRDISNVSRKGTSMAALAEAAERLGFVTRGVRTGFEALRQTALPIILHWQGNHFVVLFKIEKNFVKLADPGMGIRKLSREGFEKGWTNAALLLEYTNRVAENEASQSTFRRFLPLVRPFTGILIEILLASVVLSLLGLASPIFMQTIVDRVLVHHDRDLLNLMLTGMGVVALFQMGTATLRMYLIGYVSARLSLSMMSRFYRHLLALPLRFFALRRTGDLTTRFRENATVQRLLTGTTVSAVLDVVMLFVYLALMLYYNAELTLVTLIFVPLTVGLTLIYTPVLKSFSQRAFLARAEQSSVLIDSLKGIEVVKTEAAERVTRWQWEGRFAKEIQIGFQRLNMQMVFGAGGNLIHLLGNTVILWYGASLVMNGNLSVGQLMAFHALMGQVMGPIMGLIGLWPQVQEARIAMDRLHDVYDTPVESSRHRGVLPKHAVGCVGFDHVFFRYGVGSDEPYVINDIDLRIEPGQKVAIVGRSGAGKSTLVKMIPRLFDPSEGHVTFDGTDVRDLDPAWLRQQIGMVLQDSFLFGGTIAENIAVGQSDVDMDRVLEVAKLAWVQDFVRDMPLGYETKVGEQGMGLSGGQRQRIAIARALYRDPKILIFDEATNALDTESELAIQGYMDLFFKDRTVFVIAHRMSTVRHADVIVVLDKGHMVEMGHHDELMLKQGLYYYLNSQKLQGV